jgi:hypothetical protein
MTAAEQRIISILKNKWTEFSVTRRSEREFDLSVEGTYSDNHYLPGTKFSGWLPLIYIRELTVWPSYAHMTDYPEMVAEGDWSGVRDSENEKIWAIFHHARNR